MISFLRSFVGEAPVITSIYDFSAILEYIFGFVLLLVILLSIYSIFGNIIDFLRK